MAPSTRSRKTFLRRNATISSIKKTVRKFSSCSGVRPLSDDEARKESWKRISYRSRHAFYDEHMKQTFRDLHKFKAESSFMQTKSSSPQRKSVNNALSTNQWRSTPSPKPLRTNWSELPGKAGPAPNAKESSQQSSSEEVASLSLNNLTRKFSQWHNSVKRGKQVPQAPPLPLLTYRPLAIQTAERRKLRVKNWTDQDRSANAWANDNLLVLPHLEEASDAPLDTQSVPGNSAVAANDRAETLNVGLDKPLPSTPSPSYSMPAPKPPIVDKKFRSSIPRSVRRKIIPSRLPLPAETPESVRQPNITPRRTGPATPAAKSFKKNSRPALQDSDVLQMESTRDSKRMGRIYTATGIDMRDLPTEASSLSSQGDGSRYPLHQSVTGWLLESEFSPSDSDPSSGSPAAHVVRRRFNSCANASQRHGTKLASKVRAQDVPTMVRGQKRLSATFDPQKRHCMFSSYVDSSTQTEKPDPIRCIVPFHGILDAKSFEGSSSFDIIPPKELREVIQTVYFDTPVHLNLIGKEISNKTEAREAATAQTESSNANHSRTKPSRQGSSAIRTIETIPPVPAVPASIRSSAKTSTQAPQAATGHPTSLIPGHGRAQQPSNPPTRAHSFYPSSLTPGQRQTSAPPTTNRHAQHPASRIPGIPRRITARPQHNRPFVPSPRDSTIADLTPLNLDLPNSELDMSAVLGSTDAQYAYVEPVHQNFSRPTSQHRRKSSPRRRMRPSQLRPMTRQEIAYEHLFRLES